MSFKETVRKVKVWLDGIKDSEFVKKHTRSGLVFLMAFFVFVFSLNWLVCGALVVVGMVLFSKESASKVIEAQVINKDMPKPSENETRQNTGTQKTGIENAIGKGVFGTNSVRNALGPRKASFGLNLSTNSSGLKNPQQKPVMSAFPSSDKLKNMVRFGKRKQ